MKNADRITVQRLTDATGSHIEPPLDGRWSPLKKLQWQAAVVSLEVGGGVDLTVVENAYNAGHFNVRELSYGFGIPGPFNFDDTWLFLLGIKFGGQMAVARRAQMAGALLDHVIDVSTGTVDDGDDGRASE